MIHPVQYGLRKTSVATPNKQILDRFLLGIHNTHMQ